MKKVILCFLTLVFLSSCGSTRITSSWREPNKQLVINNLSKVLVVALFKSETSRHKAEDEMVRYLNGRGVVSYNYLNDNFNTKSEEAIHEKISVDGFDGAITMRLIDVEQEKSYSYGNNSFYSPFSQSFGGYYLSNLSFYSNPTYYFTTKIYTVETNVYSIKEKKIIWTGLTETVDPEGVDKMTSEIAKVVYKKMLQEGFIKK